MTALFRVRSLLLALALLALGAPDLASAQGEDGDAPGQPAPKKRGVSKAKRAANTRVKRHRDAANKRAKEHTAAAAQDKRAKQRTAAQDKRRGGQGGAKRGRTQDKSKAPERKEKAAAARQQGPKDDPTQTATQPAQKKRPRPIVYKDEPLTPGEQALTDGVKLNLLRHGPRKLWVLQLRNVGTESVRVLRDPRLAWFEVLDRDGKKSFDCQLPSAWVPKVTTHTKYVTLDPTDTLTVRLDPQFYCYEDGAQTRLVPGARVVPHYGFPSNSRMVWEKGKRRRLRLKQKGPYALSSVDPAGASLKEVSAEGVILGPEFETWTKAGLEKLGKHGTLQLLVTKAADAHSPMDASVEVTVRNRSQLTQRVHLRRELLSFEIHGPEGLVECKAEPMRRAPDSLNLTAIKPGKDVSMVVRLFEFCSEDAFPVNGFYYVTASLPVLDEEALEAARDADGDEVEANILETSVPRPVRMRGAEGRFTPWRPTPAVIAGGAVAPSSPKDSTAPAGP